MRTFILCNTTDITFIKPIFDKDENGIVLFSPKNIKLHAKSTTIIKLNCTLHFSNKINIFVSELASYRARHIFLNSNTQLKRKKHCYVILTNYGELNYHIKQGQKFLKLYFQKKIKPNLIIKYTYTNNSNNRMDKDTQKISIERLTSYASPASPASPAYPASPASPTSSPPPSLISTPTL